MDKSQDVHKIVVKLKNSYDGWEDDATVFNVTGWRVHPELRFLELELAEGLRVLFIHLDSILTWEVPLIKRADPNEN